MIGQSNYFGFGFTTLKWKPLYNQIKFKLITTIKKSCGEGDNQKR